MNSHYFHFQSKTIRLILIYFPSIFIYFFFVTVRNMTFFILNIFTYLINYPVRDHASILLLLPNVDALFSLLQL